VPATDTDTNRQRGRLIDGRRIAAEVEREAESAARKLREAGHIPHLVAIQVGHHEPTNLYIRRQKERISRLGIQYTHLELDEATALDALLSHVDALNENPTVTGIIATMPLPAGIPAPKVQERILPEKDVEGVHPSNLGRLIYNRRAVGPCTALAVLTAIESTGVRLEGKHVVMVGHSDIVGKPVGLCLLQEMATITTCHVATRDLREHTRQADVLVVAVGKPGIITADMVKDGVIVIDVGINRLPGPPERTVGDVDFEAVAPRATWITPVPGGIGPITVAMLARNTLACARKIFLGEE
jgi:methylenetetrahydrofolate dehydrogenase (NADP+)/methenyltetrahydrofolate cyclohydrolase